MNRFKQKLVTDAHTDAQTIMNPYKLPAGAQIKMDCEGNIDVTKYL